MGGIVDMVTGLLGGETSAAKAQRQAMEQQAEAQKKQLEMQRRQQEANLAAQQQQQNKAAAEAANASSAIDDIPYNTNESNLTGGLGIDSADLDLGSPTLLGGVDDDDEEDKIR